MDDIEIFPVPTTEFKDGPEFRKYLVENYDPEKGDNALTVLVGLTRRPEEDAFEALAQSGFKEVRHLGAIRQLRHESERGTLETYVSYERGTGVLVFYTNFRKTVEIPQINDFLRSDPKSYPLFLKPSEMERVLRSLEEHFPQMSIVDFTAKRYPGAKQEAKIRPESERTFSYWARDGRETLTELRFLYGVLPTRVVVEVPDTSKFGVDSRGFFTFQWGDLSVLFRILGEAITESSVTTKAFDGSSFQVLPVKTSSKSFDIPTSTPVQIRLQRKLEYGEVEEIESLLDSSGYTVLSTTAEEGSLFLSADVISQSGKRFRVKANEHRMKLLPADEPEFSAFMEFFEFVVTELDPHAELVV